MITAAIMLAIVWFSLSLSGALSTSINPSQPRDMSNQTNQENYLRQFGYVSNTGAQMTEGIFSEALLTYQLNWGLPATGRMNQQTKNLMETPRCGCRDIADTSLAGGRKKRFSIHSHGGWKKTDLTYKIVNTSSFLEKEISEETLHKALAEWSKITPLTFTQIWSKADLDIFFVSKGHADGFAFDGYGGVLAHAFFPVYGGNAHFDNDEHWTVNEIDYGTDLFLVAVHEFGHSLGLEHSSIKGSIMYPYYVFRESFDLHEDDIAGIQSLYGAKEDITTASVPSTTSTESTTLFSNEATMIETTSIPSSTTVKLTTSTSPMIPQPTGMPNNSCVFKNLDAITSDKSGNIFIFHGKTYTLVDHNGLVDGFPRAIATDFPEIISGKVDAAVYLPELVRDKCITRINGIRRCYEMVRPEEVFLFSGQVYHRYTGGYLESRKHKETGHISDEFQGIPPGTSVDSAFTYDGIDIYLVSGDLLWKQTRGNIKSDSCFPKSTSEYLFPGAGNLQTTIKDVFSLPTTSTYYNYFFMDDFYFRTTDGSPFFDPLDYPRDIGQSWCRNNLKNDLGFFKHHTVYVELNGSRIVIPRQIHL